MTWKPYKEKEVSAKAKVAEMKKLVGEANKKIEELKNGLKKITGPTEEKKK
jgi:hypothetical protein